MFFSSILQEALDLRSVRKIPEARKKLEEACETEDAIAHYFLAQAYLEGGWGLNRSNTKYDIYVEDARKLGLLKLININDPPIALWFVNPVPKYSIEIAESLNDAGYWYHFGYQSEKYREYAFKRAAEQNHYYAMRKLLEFYGLCSIKSVKIAIRGQLWFEQEEILKFTSEFDHLIGKEMHYNKIHPLRNSDLGKRAVNVYLNHMKSVRSEIITWLLISKEVLCKDVRNLVAFELWRLREEVWL